MVDFLEKIIERASSEIKTIILPEGKDKRIIEAAKIITERKIAKLVILGDKNETQSSLKQSGVSSEDIQIINPLTSEKRLEYAQKFYELRKHKGASSERSEEIVKESVYFGTMMVKCGDADGLVAGASHSTANTLRPALQIIRTAEGFRTVSSLFFMCSGENVFIFADCAIVENPSVNQLCEIAISTAINANMFGIEPRIAMLSYSTYSTAKGESAYKVARATERAKEKAAALFGYGSSVLIDGELQFDAAFVPEVAKIKCPNSPLDGKANIFIFPDLNSGNITYKAVQRLGGYQAYGPIVQGLAKPVNDLSRGCSVEDVVATVACTCIQAQQ